MSAPGFPSVMFFYLLPRGATATCYVLIKAAIVRADALLNEIPGLISGVPSTKRAEVFWSGRPFWGRHHMKQPTKKSWDPA